MFGRRVCERLARLPNLHIFLAGRDGGRADAMASAIARAEGTTVVGLAFDKQNKLAEGLKALDPRLVIDASGPFQGADHRIARACIEQKRHYLDLADDPTFVKSLWDLDTPAQLAGVLAVSGASSTPGLSSAVAGRLVRDFSHVDAISVGITPGNRAPRGLAVIRSILSYVGRPIHTWKDGAPAHVTGWHDIKRISLSGLGPRWFSACDTPDALLFPRHFKGVRNVSFHAGLELGFLHLGLWLLSWLVVWGVVRNLAPLAPLALKMTGLVESLGTDRGGMFVQVVGMDKQGKRKAKRWTLIAGSGHGPYVPALASVVLTRKLLDGSLTQRGAKPCLELFSIEEFLEAAADLDITTHLDEVSLP